MGLPNGLHHIAIATKNVKAQIEFFTQACGMELTALYWMHGVEKTFHAFLRMGDAYVAFVQGSEMDELDGEIGVSHASWTAGPVAPGVMQHLAFNVDNDEALYALRDRLRSHDVWVWGPIDHGLCRSMYFTGPEGLMLEFATSDVPIDGEVWIDPEVQEMAGINEEELKKYKSPPAFVSKGGEVQNPSIDPTELPMDLPPGLDLYEMSDDEVFEKLSENTPPVLPK